MHFFSAGLPTVMPKNQPLVPRSNYGAQEPTPGFAVEHCRFLGTGGGYMYGLRAAQNNRF